jgi:hypothetical protein
MQSIGQRHVPHEFRSELIRGPLRYVPVRNMPARKVTQNSSLETSVITPLSTNNGAANRAAMSALPSSRPECRSCNLALMGISG